MISRASTNVAVTNPTGSMWSFQPGCLPNAPRKTRGAACTLFQSSLRKNLAKLFMTDVKERLARRPLIGGRQTLLEDECDRQGQPRSPVVEGGQRTPLPSP